jgi:hypothetical protein
MLSKYEELDKSEHDSRHKNDLRELGNEIYLPPEITEFFIDADNIEIRKRTRKITKSSFKSKLYKFYKNFIYVKIEVPKESYYKFWPTRICYLIVVNPFFNTLIMLSIIVNTALLTTDKYPELDADVINAMI